MPNQSFTAELTIDTALGAGVQRAFDTLDSSFSKSTPKMSTIERGFRSFSDLDKMFEQFGRKIKTFAGTDWNASISKMTDTFQNSFRNVGTTVTDQFQKKFSETTRWISEKWKPDASEGADRLSQRSPPVLATFSTPPARQTLKDGFGKITQRLSTAQDSGIGYATKARNVFRGPDAEIGRTLDNIHVLKKQTKNYEQRAQHARSMEKSVSPWLTKIDRVNQKLDVQKHQLDELHLVRKRFNTAEQASAAIRKSVSPWTHRAGTAALKVGKTVGKAAIRGAQQFIDFDQKLRILQAEGVAATDIPIFEFAQASTFSDIENADVLVTMKKDGQEVNAELNRLADIIKLAVVESHNLPTAWNAMQTLINTTKTDLKDAVRLQEQMSNTTSVSIANMNLLQSIASHSLATYKQISRFRSADFLALTDILKDAGLTEEPIGAGLGKFTSTMSHAAAGTLEEPRQKTFDTLGVNITDAEGKLKSAVGILREFEKTFDTDRFKDSPVTLGTKAVNMEQSKAFAAARLKNTVDVARHRVFEVLDGDGNFVKTHEKEISRGVPAFFKGTGAVSKVGLDIFQQPFDYLRERSPNIKQFFSDFWKDLPGVLNTVKPLVIGIIGVHRELFDIVGRFAAGNTGSLAWLAAGFIGWKALKVPIMAANVAFNTVLGTIGKVRTAFRGMPAMQTAAVGLSAPMPAKMPKTSVPKTRGLKALSLPKLPKFGSVFSTVGSTIAAVDGGIASLGALPIADVAIAIGGGFVKLFSGIDNFLKKFGIDIGGFFKNIFGGEFNKELQALKFVDIGVKSYEPSPIAQTTEKQIPGIFLDASPTVNKPAVSTEYIGFSGVDEIDKTLKAGFTSLLHVNDQTLFEDINRNVIISSGFADKRLYKPISQLPYFDFAPAAINVEIAPIAVEHSETRAAAGDVTNQFSITINQQPNEDAEALVERVMTELERQSRTGYYN